MTNEIIETQDLTRQMKQRGCDDYAENMLKGATDTAAAIVSELQLEIDRLRQVARNVYEVWAGSEGIPMPETAAEAYLLQLVEQMRDEAKKGLHNAGIHRAAEGRPVG